MIYPKNFESKIGFNEIRTILRGRCLSSLGVEEVGKMTLIGCKYDIIKSK